MPVTTKAVTMKAVVVRAHGGIETLQLEEVPTPQAQSGEVLVAVHACGINHLDLWVRRGVPGHTFPLPLIPGNDIAGVIADANGFDDVPTGTEVIVSPGTSCGRCRSCLSGRDHHCRSYGILGEHQNGGYAQFVAVPRQNIINKPSALTFTQAAAVGIPFLTAWHMLIDRAGLRVGETVLVQAAGSGVGSAAIQIAKLWGAEVIATSSRSEKLERAEQLGADHVINYKSEQVAKRVKEITHGRGANVVFEHVGEATWEQSMRSLAWQGRLVTCGATTGADANINLRALFFKSLSVLGSTMGSKGDLLEVLSHVAEGRLHPVVDRVVPLRDVAEAHRALEAAEIFGKVVLNVEDGT